MIVRWRNTTAFALFLMVLWIGIRCREAITLFLGHIRSIGPGYPPEDRTFGMFALAMVILLILGIVKLLTQRGRQ